MDKKLKIEIMRNTGDEQVLIDLLEFRNIVTSQLYTMSKLIITKTIFDRVHISLIVKNQRKEIAGGICYYEIQKHKCCDIIYFAVKPQWQIEGYGNFLICQLKEVMKRKGFETIVVQADIVSLNFYYKNGFVQFPKKRKTIDIQPVESELKEQQQESEQEDRGHKYKRYEPWLEYIEQYYSSLLMVYKIHQTLNSKQIKRIGEQQKKELIKKLSGLKYRKHKFKECEMVQIINQHERTFQKNFIQYQNQKKQGKKLEEEQTRLLQNYKKVNNLQQLALLKIIKSHKSSKVLKMNFKQFENFNKKISKLLNLNEIERKAINNEYCSTSEMCADLAKFFQNLKILLPQGTHRYSQIEDIQHFIHPYISEIYLGTFNALRILQNFPLPRDTRDTSRQRNQQGSRIQE